LLLFLEPWEPNGTRKVRNLKLITHFCLLGHCILFVFIKVRPFVVVLSALASGLHSLLVSRGRKEMDFEGHGQNRSLTWY
jgi:hypothetical protein